MLKVNNRAELALLKGERPKPVEVPKPDPAAIAMASATASMDRVASLLEQQAATAPKKLEAIIHRDAAGKMARVEITVI